MNGQTSAEALAATTRNSVDLLQAINAKVQQNGQNEDPNWSHVGDANRVLTMLQDVATVLGIEVYA